MKKIIIILFLLPLISIGQSLDISNTYYDFSSINVEQKTYTDWTWIVFGDSFTATDSYYITRVTEWIEFDTVRNVGAGGETISRLSNNLKDSLTTDPTYLDDVDVLSVQFGVNDFKDSEDKTLGSVDDTVGRPTVAGKLKDFIVDALTANDAMMVFVITPVQRNLEDTVNANGWGMQDISDTIRGVCKLYAVPVVDWTNQSMINTVTNSEYISGGHPTSAGAIRLGDLVAKHFLNKY